MGSLGDILDDAALSALASQFAVGIEDLGVIHDQRNRVYGVAGGEPRVLKVIPSWVADPMLIEAEFDWVGWLYERGAPVVRPYRTRAGGWAASVESGGVVLSACMMARMAGEPMEGRVWTPPLIHALGVAMGRLHAMAHDHRPGAGALRRPEWCEMAWLARPEEVLHPSQGAVIERCHQLREALERLPRGADCYGLIHDDLHTGNLWVCEGRMIVCDFECCHTTWLISDIASALLFAIWKVPATDPGDAARFARLFLRHLRAGYESQHHLDTGWLAHLPLFLKLRETWLYVSDHAGRDLSQECEDTLTSFQRHNIEYDVPYVRLDDIPR